MILKNMFYNQTNEIFSRFTMMLNEEQIKKLFSSRIIVFGVGGVGGALINMLVRSGVQNIDIVDFDTIDITNINRQFVANIKNIGNLKVHEYAHQLLEINPELNIKTFPIKLDSETIKEFNFKDYDYIVDCIDDVAANEAAYMIYPKPFEGVANVLFAQGGVYEVSVFATDGKLVSKNAVDVDDNEMIEVSVENAGTYVVVITKNGKPARSFKIVM